MFDKVLNLEESSDQLIVCSHWLSSEKKDIYVFAGQADVKEETFRDAKTRKVHILSETIRADDTVDTLVRKFVGYAMKHQIRSVDLYGWYTRQLHEHDLIDLLNLAYDKRVTMRSEELLDLFKVNFRKSVRLTKDSLYDKASALELISEKRIRGRMMPLGCEFRYPTSERVRPIAPWPFEQSWMEQDDARRVRDPHRIVANLLSADNSFHFVERSVLNNPVYFDDPETTAPHEGKTGFDETVKRMDDLLEEVHNEVVESVVPTGVNHRVEKLVFRVFPRGNTPLQIDMGTALKKLETSARVPVICHQALRTNVYKIDREVMKTLSESERGATRAIVKDVTNLERDRRDRSISRKGEHLVCYCIYKDFYFRVVINTNGSYRVFYRFKRTDQEGFRELNKSFGVIGDIVKVLDDSMHTMFVLSPDVNIFDHERVEIVDQITFTKVTTNRKLVSESAMLANMRGLPWLFGEVDDKVDLLRYKRVDRFRNVNAISYFVHNNIHLSPAELGQRVMREFGMNQEEAEDAIEDARYDANAPGVQRRGGSLFALRRYNAGLLLRLSRVDDFTIKVRAINSANPTYTTNAIRALVYCATKSKLRERSIPKDSNPPPSILPEVTYADLYETSVHTENDAMDDDMRDFLQEVGSDIDLGFDASSEFNEENDVGDQEDVEEQVPEESEPEEVDVEQEEGKRYTNFVLSKLIEADKDLFTWDNKNYSNYATKCGAVNYRQPIVITQEEKDRIDRDHPKSYTGYVKTGSTEEKREKYFYICPSMWCKLGRYSLSKEEYEKNGNKCGAPYFEQPLMFPPPNKPNYFLNKNNVSIRVPRFLKESMHPNKFLLPCCAKTSKDAVYDTNPATQSDSKDSLKYIARISHDKPMAPGRLGGVTSELARLLGTKEKVGSISKDTTTVVRTGVEAAGGHSLARCLETILNIDNFYERVAERMEVWHYIAMNQGNTMRLFSDPKDAELLSTGTKERSVFLKYMTSNVAYVKMFGLESLLAVLKRHKGGIPAAHTQRVAATREFVIFRSMQRFKRYILDDRFVKSEHDLLHLAHFDFLNPNRIGVMILSENTHTETRLVYPRYFDMGAVMEGRERFGVCLKVDGGYEYLQGVQGLSERSTLFFQKPSSIRKMNVGHLLRSFPMKRSSRAPEGSTLVLGYDSRLKGYLNGETMVELDRELRFESEREERKVVYDSSDVDALLFTASESLPTESYGTDSYKVARRVLRKRDMREDMALLRHHLNPMTTTEKLDMIEQILKDNKTELPDEGVRAVCKDLLLKSPGFIVREYETRTRVMPPGVVLVARESVLRGDLMRQYERALNVYQMWDSSAADNLVEVDSVLLGQTEKGDPAEPEKRERETAETINWTKNYVPLEVERIQKTFSKLSVHDTEITWDELVRVFGKGRVASDVFLEDYLKHMSRMHEEKPKEFQQIIKANPSIEEHPKIQKKWPMDDLRKIVTSGTFHLSTHDIDFVAQYFDVGILLLQRGGAKIGPGVDFKGKCKDDTIYVLQATTNMKTLRPKRHFFRFVIYEKGVLEVPLLAIREKVRNTFGICNEKN